jgi:hypothetical protein
MDAYVILYAAGVVCSAASLSTFTFTFTHNAKRCHQNIPASRDTHHWSSQLCSRSLAIQVCHGRGCFCHCSLVPGLANISREQRDCPRHGQCAYDWFSLLSYRLIEASLARPKPKMTTQASSLAPSSETLSPPPPPPAPPRPSDAAESQADSVDEKADGVPLEGGEQEQEDESSGGAFDPVTGKINWDCPCLGGMAYGPCGMQFREAFSCFVFSEEEPKGIDCVEKFKAMQDCFRENPDVYGDGTHESVGLYLPQQTILFFKQKF